MLLFLHFDTNGEKIYVWAKLGAIPPVCTFYSNHLSLSTFQWFPSELGIYKSDRVKLKMATHLKFTFFVGCVLWPFFSRFNSIWWTILLDTQLGIWKWFGCLHKSCDFQLAHDWCSNYNPLSMTICFAGGIHWMEFFVE